MPEVHVKKYRADVDGLRAVAVLSVVLYHYSVSGFSGGFVGVDVFFVISGYLITNIIYPEIKNGRFSVVKFYLRRIRRIIPVLYLVIAVTLLGASVVLLPVQFYSAAKAAIAALGFVSNILFWRETGYFGETAEMQPFLHLWSLSIEEQYYFLYPIVIVALRRVTTSKILLAIVLLSIVSLVAAEIMLVVNQAAAFYLLPARAWELGCGGVVALKEYERKQNIDYENAISILGMSCLLMSIIFFGPNTKFPGLSALVPVFGASCILYCRPTAVANRVLSWGPFVWIGLISFSLYLWHWPIMIFVQHYLVERQLQIGIKVLAIACTFIVSLISWKYVEKPFRDAGWISSWRLLASAAVVTVCLGLGALLIITEVGMPGRFEASAAKSAAAAEDISILGRRCMDGKWHLRRGCEFGAKTDAAPSIAVWGDSFAAALVPAVEYAATKEGKKAVFIGGNTCAPLIGAATTRLSPKWRQECLDGNDQALRALGESKDIETVILTASWDSYISTTAAKMQLDGELADNKVAIRIGLSRVIDRLKAMNKTVIILYDLPNPGFNVPWELALRKIHKKSIPVVRWVSSNFIDELVSDLEIRSVRLASALCVDEICKVESGDLVYYSDAGHLTASAASKIFGPLVLSAISGTAAH